MQWKLVSAFATGAVLASGIVYFAVKPQDVVQPPPLKPAAAAPLPAPPQIAAAPVPPVVPVPQVAKEAPAPARVSVREKPSPMPPPVRRQPEVVIARSEPPPVISAPASAPAPPTAEPAPAHQPTAPPPAPEPAPAPPVPVENVSVPPPEPETRTPHTVTLSAGTLLAVRIGETISSAHNQPGDTFLATLTRPLVIDGWIIADRGERVEGRVIEATQAGRGGGSSQLAVSLVRLATDDRQNIAIRTEPYTKHGASAGATDAAKVGAGAAIGAVIGAIAGGGKGAAIGAGAGGAVGVGDVLLTRGRPAEIPVETLITFRVEDSVTITERLE